MAGKFSHCFYDDSTETVYIYFKKVTILPLDDVGAEEEYEEVAVYLDPEDYENLVKYIQNHPTKESL